MNLTRRGFLKSILAIGVAPAIVKAENLMKLWVPPQDLILPPPFAVEPLAADGEVIIWGAQLEAGIFPGERLFSSFIQVADGLMKRVAMRATIPAGVSPRVVIKKDGSIDIEGGLNKALVETVIPQPMNMGGGYHLTSDYISQQVPPMADEHTYLPLVAGNYVSTPEQEPVRRIRNQLLHSESFTQSIWTTEKDFKS